MGIMSKDDFRQQDTYQIAKANFRLTSYKLEYMAKFFNLKNQKFVKREFTGHSLWRECMKGNPEAWREMREYNPQDVLATEELMEVLLPHDKSINYNTYYEDNENRCSCGSFVLRKNGFRHRNGGKFQRFQCDSCGKPHIGKHNLLSTLKRSDMLK
jgi:hypothetical protein